MNKFKGFSNQELASLWDGFSCLDNDGRTDNPENQSLLRGLYKEFVGEANNRGFNSIEDMASLSVFNEENGFEYH